MFLCNIIITNIFKTIQSLRTDVKMYLITPQSDSNNTRSK